jgi:ATP-dependent exoDNAse (exonuclease V) beta subunit
VLERPGGDPAGDWTVAPGLHRFEVDRGVAQEAAAERAGAEVEVVWWDPHALRLDAQAPGGLRREELIAKDQAETLDPEGLARYREWQEARGNALASASAPSLRVRTMTEWARSGDPWPVGELMPDVEVLRLPRRGPRPAGTRFGTLVHAVFALAPLDGSERAIPAIAGVQGRLCGAPAAEVAAAAELVTQALRAPLLSRAAHAARRERCRREVPVTLSEGGCLFEGTIDLLFEEDGRWQLVDFKSDAPTDAQLDVYRRQVALYAAAASRALGLPVSPVILAV